MKFRKGDRVRLKPPRDGKNRYMVVLEIMTSDGIRVQNSVGDGYTPEQAVDYVFGYCKNLRREDVNVTKIVPFEEWAGE